MAPPQNPQSRPGRLRVLGVGETVVETEVVATTPEAAAARRQAVLNSWCTAITRVPEFGFSTFSTTVVDGSALRIFVVVTRTS